MNHTTSLSDNGNSPASASDNSDSRSGRSDIGAIAWDLMGALSQHLAEGEEAFAEFDNVEDCVYVKNSRGVIVYSNEAHRRFFTPGETPVGRTSHTYLPPSVADRVDKVSEMVMAGCPYVECEHTCPGPDGATYRVRAHKRSLQALGAPGFALLGVIRVVEKDDNAAKSEKLDLDGASARFRELTERDQEICRLTALGVSSRELGERLGMTTRGIELRKQKAFAHLGVAKAVDLARLLVRLQDRGYFDLGL